MKMRLDYPLEGGIERMFKLLKIDPSDPHHLAFFSLQVWMLPFCAATPRWWTMSATDGSLQYVKVNIRPTFMGIPGRRIVRDVTFMDCSSETCLEMAKVVRNNQIKLVEWLLHCPGRGSAVRKNSKPTRVLDIASELISRAVVGTIGVPLLDKRFSNLIKITQRN